MIMHPVECDEIPILPRVVHSRQNLEAGNGETRKKNLTNHFLSTFYCAREREKCELCAWRGVKEDKFFMEMHFSLRTSNERLAILETNKTKVKNNETWKKNLHRMSANHFLIIVSSSSNANVRLTQMTPSVRIFFTFVRAFFNVPNSVLPWWWFWTRETRRLQQDNKIWPSASLFSQLPRYFEEEVAGDDENTWKKKLLTILKDISVKFSMWEMVKNSIILTRYCSSVLSEHHTFHLNSITERTTHS